MLVWSSVYFLFDYFVSQMQILFISEEELVKSYLNIETENNYSFYEIKNFHLDKIVIVLVLWTRLQLHRFLVQISEEEEKEIEERISETSKMVRVLVQVFNLLERIIFVVVLVLMILFILFYPVNCLFGILLFFMMIIFLFKFSVNND